MHKEMLGKTEFTFMRADSPEMLGEVFGLRYQVYCNECNFLDAKDYPDRTEKDKYDPYSLHFVAKDSYGLIGTSRLILNSPLGFPLEEHCASTLTVDKDSLPKEDVAEISRLVISKKYRRRSGDGLYYTPDYNDNPDSSPAEDLIKRIRPMAFGIYREMYQESKQRKIAHWYAVMERSLYVLLRMHGFVFRPIGDEVDFYGPVKPYLGNIEEMEREVYKRFPNLFKYFMDGLDAIYQPKIS